MTARPSITRGDEQEGGATKRKMMAHMKSFHQDKRVRANPRHYAGKGQRAAGKQHKRSVKKSRILPIRDRLVHISADI